MNKWTKTACLTLCAGMLVSGVAAGLRGDPTDDAKKALKDAQKQMEDMKKKMMDPPAKGAQPGEDPMMAMMMEMSKPAAEHNIIQAFAGNWNAAVKMWMDPSQKEPTVSTGTMKATLMHGGRYLQGEYTGDFAGMPFTGTMTWAYNRIDGRYESTWIDSFGTGIMMSTGKASADGKTVESTAEFRMPGPDGKLMTITQRETITMVNKDKFTMDMWHATKEQGETKVMEIVYTRAADEAAPAHAPHPAAPAPAAHPAHPVPAVPAVPAVPGITMPPK